MAKQNINVGTAANDKKGDSLRAAFVKVNANFTELYTALGINADGTLNLGAFEFAGSVMSTTDSTAIVIDQATTVTSDLTVGGDIVPSIANGGNLGSLAKPFRSLYVSNNTIFLGGTALSVNGAGNLLVNGSLITGGGVSSYADLSGKPALSSVATTGAYADLTGKPTIPTSFSSLVNGAHQVALVVGGAGPYVTFPADDGVSIGFQGGDIGIIGGEALLSSTEYGVRLTANSTGTRKDWEFATDGSLTLPGDLKWPSGGGNIRSDGNINIDINLADSTLRRWQFGEDGDTVFPNNVSIISGGASYRNITGDNGISLSQIGNGNDGSSNLLWYGATQSAKIQLNRYGAGNLAKVIVSAEGTGGIKTWTFDETGALTLPIGVSIDSSVSPLYPKIIGDSGKLFSIQGQGSTGSAALAWSVNPNADTKYAAVGVNQGGGDNLAKVVLTAGNTTATLKVWKLDETGAFTFPDNTVQTTAWTGVVDYNTLANKPNIAGTYQFSVAADDSTQRVISNNELIKFIGAGGITTSSDAEGYITITGSGGSSLVNGAYTASLGNTGALTLPAGGIISEGGGLTGAIKLRPAGGANANQALLIYPTAGGDGDHIHLTAGGGSTELYLGNDSRYVKLANGGDIAVLANNGAVNRVYNWAGQGGWNSPPYTNLATTGGTGTGLRVNVTTANGGYTDITAITIHTAGTGYTVGDVITITNENNLTSTFQIGVAAAGWTFGTDGSLASEEFKIKTLNGVPTSITGQTNDNQFWDYNYGSNLATTGGTGTGLFVNVGDGGNGYASISINVAGTGYSPGDVITVTNGPFNGAPYASTVTFTIGISGTRSWTFDRYGSLTLPSGNSSSSVIQSVQSGNYQSKVTVSPFQILSQARTSQTQSYSAANGDFTSASSDGNGMINFVSPTGSVTEFIIDTIENGGVYERTVRLNGAGPEYGYSSFNGTNQVSLAITAPAGAVNSIRFSYTRISKIDIDPDEGVFRIESEPGQDIDIQAGDDLQLIATDRTDITAGTNMRLRAGDGSVQIATNFYNVSGATTYTWTFGTGGELTLPNGAVLRNTSGSAVAFGQGAGLNSQSAMAIAIGSDAGYYTQGAAAVAIGESAGESYQGANAIAIGKKAGYNNQAANSIILNATGDPLEQTTANTFTVAPIRNISATSGVLQYNASTKEVSYNLNVTAESFNTDQITIVGNRIAATVTNANLELEGNSVGGVVINTVAEATTASTTRAVGYLGLPPANSSISRTLTIIDSGKHTYITTTGVTLTIPAASSVAYPVGTTLTFIAGPSATTVTIAINTDTLRLAGGTSTGTRTLAANGMATAVKVSGTSSAGVWYINGIGLT